MDNLGTVHTATRHKKEDASLKDIFSPFFVLHQEY